MTDAIRACPGVTNARVLVVGHHAPFRFAWCDVIDSLPDYKVIGGCDLGQDTGLMVGAFQPDLVFIDIRAHESDGLAAVANIVRKQPETRIVVHSARSNRAHVLDVLDAGANAFLYLNDAPFCIEPALQSALSGRVFISPSLCPPAQTTGREASPLGPRQAGRAN